MSDTPLKSLLQPKDASTLVIGVNRKTGVPVEIPSKTLKRHIVALGASGSGKTVLCKVIIEEATRQDIPTILVDPQGDIASLGLLGNSETIQAKGVDPVFLEQYRQRASVRIYTPASSRGIPISIQPLKFPDANMPEEDLIRSLDFMGVTITRFLGYDESTDQGKAAQSLLFHLFQDAFKLAHPIPDFSALAELVMNPSPDLVELVEGMISERERSVLARRLKYLTVGTNSLLFNYGVPLDIDTFLARDSSGKTPLNIIYLNTLNDQEDKLLFLAILARELYDWMLRHPSDQVQLLFYLDELAPYLPPHPYTPPPKTMLKMIFKQARKYGVGLVAATQNPTDLDYKALAQVGTWALGRMMTKQDIDRVRHILRAISPENVDEIADTLPKLLAGEFLLLSPDVFQEVIPLRTRWLVTEHKTLDEDQLGEIVPDSLREFLSHLSKTTIEAVKLPQKKKDLKELLLEQLEEAKTFQTSELANLTGLTEKQLNNELKVLVGDQIVDTEEVNGTKYYWLHEYNFNLHAGVIAGERIAKLKVNKKLAETNAKKFSGGLLGAIGIGLRVLGSRMCHFPVWIIEGSFQERKIVGKERNLTRTFYVNALTGQFLVIRNNPVSPAFIDQTASSDFTIIKGEPIENRAEFTSRLQAELIESRYEPIISQQEAIRLVHTSWAAEPVNVYLGLFPVWEVELPRSNSLKTIYVDGIIGFPYRTDPIPKGAVKRSDNISLA